MKETVEDLDSQIVRLQAERNLAIDALRKKKEALEFIKYSKLIGTCWKIQEYSDDYNYYSYRKLVSCDNLGSYLRLKIFYFEEHKCNSGQSEPYEGSITVGWRTDSSLDYYQNNTKISTSEFERAYKRHLKKMDDWKKGKTK